jgi:hypothetical protein
MSYTSETREEFFRDEWDIVVKEIDIACVGAANLPPPLNQDQALVALSSLKKMALIIKVLSEIICDDQAEIVSLKAIAKAKGAH